MPYAREMLLICTIGIILYDALVYLAGKTVSFSLVLNFFKRLITFPAINYLFFLI